MQWAMQEAADIPRTSAGHDRVHRAHKLACMRRSTVHPSLGRSASAIPLFLRLHGGGVRRRGGDGAATVQQDPEAGAKPPDLSDACVLMPRTPAQITRLFTPARINMPRPGS